MKMVTAYIRYEAFGPTREALLEQGLPSLTIVEVKGTGRQHGVTEQYRGSSITNYLRPKLKLEMAVEDEKVQLVIDTILANGQFGAVGDGKIVVTEIEQAIRVRTGESGPTVLQAHLGTASPD